MRLKPLLSAGALVVLASVVLFLPDASPAASASAVAIAQVDDSPCLACHEGIESIRDPASAMMLQISSRGDAAGDPAGCTVCHGGNLETTDDPVAAHEGAPAGLVVDRFYPDPGSVWIADQTCGQCHPQTAYALERSLMNTEAGKIQGNMFTWTVQKDDQVIWGNYDVDDPDGPDPHFGTDSYKAYMLAMIEEFPGQFPNSLSQLPNPSLEDILDDPFQAGFTYQRQQCQRCHVGIKGRQVRGDYRGMGCSSCHIPYSNEGLYEGGDPTIPKDEPGRLLTHQMAGTREALGGIPTESCVTCHNRGKRIGVTFQGLMEFPWNPLHRGRRIAATPPHQEVPSTSRTICITRPRAVPATRKAGCSARTATPASRCTATGTSSEPPWPRWKSSAPTATGHPLRIPGTCPSAIKRNSVGI